jgi:uncharacterized protein
MRFLMPEPTPPRTTMSVLPLNKLPLPKEVGGAAFFARPRLLFVLAGCLGLTGCFGFLKPAGSSARRFVLTPLAEAEAVPAKTGALAVGVAQVKLPGYLLNSSLAVRKGTNEMDYLPQVLWAERLDSGLQRVLAANLSALLPTDRIRLTAWRSEDVAAGVYVAIEQFDVDASGRGVLVAWWRVLSSDGEKTLRNGKCDLAHKGPSPEADPSGAVTTLSGLVADLSRELAQAVKEAAPGMPPALKVN